MNVARDWRPPADWRRITTLDAHAAGEPLRLVVAGLDPIPGRTILEKRRYARDHLDGLRRSLMFEPRGHADMYGAILTEPERPDGDAGVLFMHNEGWSTMCGHGVIAVATIAVEVGLLPRAADIRLDVPAGRVVAHPSLRGDRVASVAFDNVPSFVVALDETIEVPEMGPVRYDLAFGGAFYAYVDATALGLELSPAGYRELIEAGTAIKRAVMSSREIPHPFETDLSFLYGTIFTGPARAQGARSRNVCVFAEGEVDRSPTGTGVSGRVAIEHARGRLRVGEPFVVESIVDTTFTGSVVGTTRFGSYEAVVPRIEGSAWITGRSEHWIAPGDPLREGFILR